MNGHGALDPAVCRDVVRRALAEDVGAGDVTTRAIVPPGTPARATLHAKSRGVICGLDLAREACRQVDETITFEALRADGDRVEPGSTIARLHGPAAGVLTAERTALDLLQHMSGIATLTRQFVDAAAGGLRVLDTRKTLPTLRPLAKYAVRCGGGTNHRFRLDDGVLIKDNHIRLAGGIGEAVRRVRAGICGLAIEVETQSLAQVDEAIEAGADVIMLDNMTTDDMREAVRQIRGRARVEISGGVSLARMAELAAVGADTVSVGALTHSAPAADISLEFEDG